MSVRNRRIMIGVIWAAALIGWFIYQRSTGLSALEALQEFVDTARGAWWAFAVFILVYALRPIVLLSAALLTIAGGILFGPVLGIVATVIGANLSAMVAYWIGRSLVAKDDEDGAAASAEKAEAASQTRELIGRWSDRMRENSFTTVMIMRLLFLPYDQVNYAAGALRIAPLPFLAATAIGSLPGTVSFTLAGASIERISDGLSGFDPRVFAASVVLFVVSLAGARLLGRRQDQTSDEPRDRTPDKDLATT